MSDALGWQAAYDARLSLTLMVVLFVVACYLLSVRVGQLSKRLDEAELQAEDARYLARTALDETRQGFKPSLRPRPKPAESPEPRVRSIRFEEFPK